MASFPLLLENTVIASGLKRRFYTLRKEKMQSEVPSPKAGIIYLHGLTAPGELQILQRQFTDIAELAKLKSIIPLFPIGEPKAYIDDPKMLGWGENTKYNQLFVNKLIQHMREEYSLDQVILFGFSSGAYFLSSTVFEKGGLKFWLQGGGRSSSAINSNYKKHPIVLEIGSRDNSNIQSVLELKGHLIDSDWCLHKDLLFRELDAGHELSLENFAQNVTFLTNTDR